VEDNEGELKRKVGEEEEKMTKEKEGKREKYELEVEGEE
jgi:hypothetical protein